jgi:hypothetical protein
LPKLHFDSKFAQGLASGWQISDVTILQTGTPFTVCCSTAFEPVYNSSGTIVGNSGCDYNADGFDYDVPDAPSFGNTKHGNRSAFINGLFSASDFPAPPLGQEGNLGRNTFTGPGYADSDMSLAKHTPIPWFGGEKADVEFCMEAFNIFNRVNLTNMLSDLANPEFGHATQTFGARDFQFGIRLSF